MNTEHITFQTHILPLKNELFRLALRITLSREDAEDVVQETMLKVWNKREQWERIDNIEAFCMTICRNLALDHQKRMDNQNVTLEETTTLNLQPLTSTTPEEHAVQRDRVERVRQLIDQLPEKQRTCMQLREVEGKAYKEIAAIMGISEEQVKVNIFRARQTIRQQFMQMEEFSRLPSSEY